MNPGPTTTETLLGGTTLSVPLLNGQTEQVKVRQVPMRMMKELIGAMEDPAALIALCTGKKLEWTDYLTPEAFDALATECDRINADFLARWVRLQNARVKVLAQATAGAPASGS